jgi:hypothetical protein
MNRYTLLAPVVMIAAVCFACVQSPTTPASQPQALSIHGRPPVCSFDASKVRILQQNYDPNFNHPHYLSPGSPGTIQVSNISNQMRDDINNAFVNAPPSVQREMCVLTGFNVFIDSDTCSNGVVVPCQPISAVNPAWGLRDPSNGKMYIAIPGSLWSGGSAGSPANAESLVQYEDAALQAVVAKVNNSVWSASPPRITSSKPIDTWPAVLAALAHELGHVKFFYTIHGKNQSFTALQPCLSTVPGTSDVPDFFSGWSYNNPKKLVPKDSWRLLLDKKSDDNGSSVDHSATPLLSQFPASANPDQLLTNLLTSVNQPWPSFWGAWSPDEQFVETYVLYALAGDAQNPGNVQKLEITIGGSPYDIIQGIPNMPALNNRIGCVASLPIL